ncbi:hypothetical protein [Pedobacter jejuensis]|uniref:WD40 repeat domain-containing protein n=1 Tax=Pedobacter jejuensis TaxID=1268550 RepID=A0A3N0BZT3_9SPHI|nr:hypothetical protein [Pedobacter jejuensis]RNL55403.1 hypothetical protein D7004_04805 [Pedobacter jejuensis]
MTIDTNRLTGYPPARIVFFTFLLLCFGSIASAQNTVVKIIPAELSEISGLFTSKNNLLFVHNDSGDTSRFFAIDVKGNLVSTLYFKGDPSQKHFGVNDCEDIAGGPGIVKDKSYIYLGDIGDNGSNRPYVTVYRFQEPNKFSSTMQIESEAVHLKYPNGPQDAETLMVDPILKELIIISKRQDTVGIYSTALFFKNKDTLTMKKQGSLFLPGKGLAKYVVSGDISRDGRQIIVKTYTNVYYWQRNGKESISQTLKRMPIKLPYILERQGEAIGFTPDGKAYYCISEGKNAVIYRYNLPNTSSKQVLPSRVRSSGKL